MPTMDLSQTYEWIAAFEKEFKPDSFLRNQLFPNVKVFNDRSEQVLMDYRKGNRKMAPFIVPGNVAPIERDDYSVRAFKPALFGGSRQLSAESLGTRAFGEDPFRPVDGQKRAAQIRAKDYKDLRYRIERRLEWMCAQMLISGSFVSEGIADDGGSKKKSDTVTLQGFTNKKTISTADDKWDVKTADIWSQIVRIRTEMAASGNAPTMMIANTETVLTMAANETLVNKLFIPDEKIGIYWKFFPEVVGDNIVGYGVFLPGNIKLYAYDGLYEDDTGASHPYIPDGYVIFAKENIGAVLAGAVNQLNGSGSFETVSGLYIPKEWDNQASDTTNLRLVSRSVPMPYDVDSWYSLKAF